MNCLVLSDRSRLMVIAPHPDDESLAAAGLLQQAVSVGAGARVLFLTSGENNAWAQRFYERRCRITNIDKARWGRLRQDEALQALATLGLSQNPPAFLGYPDQGLTTALLTRNDPIIEQLVKEINCWNPSLLICPSLMDLHPDHSAASIMVRLALDRLGQSKDLPTLMEYLVHQRKKTSVPNKALAFALSQNQQETKRQAILRHHSQIAFLSRRFLKFATSEEKFFLAEQGSVFGTCFPPMRSVFVRDDYLHLELTPRSRLGAFGTVTIFFVISQGGKVRRTLQSQLPKRNEQISRAVDLKDIYNGPFIAQLECHKEKEIIVLKVPLLIFEPADRIFFKMQRQWGFFDEAGWQELFVK